MSKKHRSSGETGPRMYCGPSIPGVATTGLLFSEAPPQLQKCMEECPSLEQFVIAPTEYTRVRQNIARKGSLEYIQYHKVLEYLKGR